MITVERLTKTYGGFRAVDDVSFTCRPGAVTGFLGPNGAGKTTTMRVIAGLTPATSGSATIAGTHYRDIPNPGTQVGVLLDASAQHAGRHGVERFRHRVRVELVLDVAKMTNQCLEARLLPSVVDMLGQDVSNDQFVGFVAAHIEGFK